MGPIVYLQSISQKTDQRIINRRETGGEPTFLESRSTLSPMNLVGFPSVKPKLSVGLMEQSDGRFLTGTEVDVFVRD